ncbi:MAG: hypothetical protein AAFR81_10970 [Chloroflexota bacterium]
MKHLILLAVVMVITGCIPYVNPYVDRLTGVWVSEVDNATYEFRSDGTVVFETCDFGSWIAGDNRIIIESDSNPELSQDWTAGQFTYEVLNVYTQSGEEITFTKSTASSIACDNE